MLGPKIPPETSVNFKKLTPRSSAAAPDFDMPDG
jgi:hypothetical protein